MRRNTVPIDVRFEDPGGGVVESVAGGTPADWPDALASSAMIVSMCSTMEENDGRCFGSWSQHIRSMS